MYFIYKNQIKAIIHILLFKGVRPKNVVKLSILNKLIEYIFQYFQIMKKFRSKMMIFVLNDQKIIVFLTEKILQNIILN